MKLDDLREYGANVEEGLSRCVNSEELYLELVGTVACETRFAELERALEDGRLDDAFEAAHALKGILGNLGLAPLYEPVNEITEMLRARTDTDYTALMAQISREKERFDAITAR